MAPGLQHALFSPDHWHRLAAVGRVLNAEPIPALDSAPATALLADADVLVTSWGCGLVGPQVLAAAPDLRLIAHAAGTVRHHLTPDVWQRGIRVTSAAAAGAPPVAEFTFAAIVFCTKDVFRIRDDYRTLRDRHWCGPRTDDLRLGNRGRRIGVVGASYVGRLVLERLRTIEAEVQLSDPYVDAATAASLGATKAELDDLLAWADVVTLHAPALPDTHHMIGARELARMRDGAWLVNTARGWLVDHDALVAEVVSGRLNAFIDTALPEPLPADSPLYDLPNVVLTPHIAGATGSEIQRMGELAVQEVERFAAGAEPLYPVTAADLSRVA